MSPPRALLINPWIYDFAAYNLWFRPLGLLYLGGWLERSGFTVSLIDCLESTEKERKYGAGNFRKEVVPRPEAVADVPRRFGRYGMPLDDFAARVRQEERPDIICITSQMTYWYPGIGKALDIVKDAWPDIPVLLGGIYTTLCREHAASVFGNDVHVAAGPFEHSAVAVLKFLGFDKYIKNNNMSLFKEMIDPVYHLYRDLPYAAVLSTRGCPFHCRYCASDRLYDRFEHDDPARVVRQIRRLEHTAGVKDFAFFDDALLCGPEKHFIPLAQGLTAAGSRCRFHLPNGISPRMITPRIAELMYRARFKTLRLSFESVRQERQADSSKKVTSEDLVRAASHLKQAGFEERQLEAYVLMGVPGQSVAEVVESMLFVRSCGGIPRLASYALIPGTPYYDESLKEMNTEGPLDPLLHNNSTYPVWRKKYSWDTINAVNLMKRYIHALQPDECRKLSPDEAEEAPARFLARLGSLT